MRRLFCLPFAGGGAVTYRLWHRTLPDDIEVVAAMLPGREARLNEAPLTSVAAMVDDLLPSVLAASDMPYAIFGHSMGALVAFELAKALERSGGRPPSQLFVSARRSPDEPETRAPMHALPEPAFLDEMQRRYGGIPAEVRAERELLDLLLPTLRADTCAFETYAMSAGPAVRCPVHVYGGVDDAHPTPAQLPAWERALGRPVRVRVFAGDHFYLNAQRDTLTADIAEQWQPDVAPVLPS
ncbi:MAG: alpha/beta fold hydrolase [Gemmatimonadaceae bacterium]|nr:alpha/beta fold hydrolase [Gemmatimonadaceae bacterium]